MYNCHLKLCEFIRKQMKKIKSSDLNPQWKNIYDNTKYHRKLSKNENNERHKIFNNMLLNYLYTSQENQYLPSKEKMEKIASKFLEDAEEKQYLGDENKDRFSAIKMDSALTEMSYAPILTDHDEEGELETTYLIVYGIVSNRGLSFREKDFLLESFGQDAEIDPDFGAIKIRLMQLPVSIENITEEMQDKINEYCLRFCRNYFNEALKREKGMDTGFKYGFIQKLKDIYFNGKI